MVKTIDEKDNEILKDVNFSKNAMFYKDLLAFYDAYQNLMEAPQDKLPSYVFWNKNYCLEGVCLFMKDYAVVLGFESLNLSLSYLKTLYFYIASLSEKTGFMPEREKLQVEFETYKQNTIEVQKALMGEENETCEKLTEAKINLKEKSKASGKNSALSHTFNILSIIFLSAFLAVFILDVPLLFFELNATQFLIVLLTAIISFVLAVVPFIFFRWLSKKFDSRENGTAYEKQKAKRQKEETNDAKLEVNFRLNSVVSEKYECEHNLIQTIFGETTPAFEEILKFSKEYSMPSYNMKRDCIILFKNQEKEINFIISEIFKPTKIENASTVMNDLYDEISSKDWLYYNGLIRLAYLTKYIELAEKTFVWELGKNGNSAPFSIDIKKIAKEQIAFLKNPKALFVSCTADKFCAGNFVKNQTSLKLKASASLQELKNIKASYIEKFYDYEKVKEYNNLFYDKKISSGAKVPENIILNGNKIPTLIEIKLRLMECLNHGENSESQTVLSLEKTIFNEDEMILNIMTNNIQEITISNKPCMIYECESVEETETQTIFMLDGKKIIGYKI